jgi:hypothetical protein
MPQEKRLPRISQQRRQTRHIEQSYGDRGGPKKEADHRAWITVNKERSHRKNGSA